MPRQVAAVPAPAHMTSLADHTHWMAALVTAETTETGTEAAPETVAVAETAASAKAPGASATAAHTTCLAHTPGSARLAPDERNSAAFGRADRIGSASADPLAPAPSPETASRPADTPSAARQEVPPFAPARQPETIRNLCSGPHARQQRPRTRGSALLAAVGCHRPWLLGASKIPRLECIVPRYTNLHAAARAHARESNEDTQSHCIIMKECKVAGVPGFARVKARFALRP